MASINASSSASSSANVRDRSLAAQSAATCWPIELELHRLLEDRALEPFGRADGGQLDPGEHARAADSERGQAEAGAQTYRAPGGELCHEIGRERRWGAMHACPPGLQRQVDLQEVHDEHAGGEPERRPEPLVLAAWEAESEAEQVEGEGEPVDSGSEVGAKQRVWRSEPLEAAVLHDVEDGPRVSPKWGNCPPRPDGPVVRPDDAGRGAGSPAFQAPRALARSLRRGRA